MVINKNWLVILFLLSFTKNYSATCTATITGSWTDPSIWSCGAVPICGDNINIPSDITVTIATTQDYSPSSPCSIAMTLTISGTLKFDTGKKLKLPCGSIVYIAKGGSILPGGGGGSSNTIEICDAVVWKAADGALFGALTLTDAVLPIELIDFSAIVLANNTVNIKWQTATEKNNNFFEVERSIDGIGFETIATIKSKSLDGNSLQTLNYEVIDENPQKDISYYRLKQTDFSGKYSISKYISISINKENNVSFIIFPNPNNGEFYVNVGGIENNHEIEVFIYDNKQALIYNAKTDIESVINKQFNFKLKETLKVGLYNVLFVMEGVRYKCNLIIQ